MDNDKKFWLSLFGIIGATVLGAVFLSLAYWKDHNTKIVQLIEQGVPAVEALCALQDDYGKHPTCIIAAMKEIRK